MATSTAGKICCGYQSGYFWVNDEYVYTTRYTCDDDDWCVDSDDDDKKTEIWIIVGACLAFVILAILGLCIYKKKKTRMSVGDEVVTTAQV